MVQYTMSYYPFKEDRNMLKKLAALCLAALMTLALVPAGVFAAGGTLSGSGTEEAPYLIEDAEDWNTFAAGFTDSIKIGRAHV